MRKTRSKTVIGASAAQAEVGPLDRRAAGCGTRKRGLLGATAQKSSAPRPCGGQYTGEAGIKGKRSQSPCAVFSGTSAEPRSCQTAGA